MKSSRSLIDWVGVILAAIFIVSSASPFLTHYGHALQRAWIVYGLWLITVLLGRMDARERAWRELRRRKAELVILGAWIGMVAVNAVVGRGFTSDLHILHAMNMALMVVLGVYYAAQPDRQFERVLALGLTLLGLEVLRSIPTLWMEPGIARLSMQVYEVRQELKEDAIAAGVGQYGFYTALAIILPGLVAQSLLSRGIVRTAILLAVGVCVAAIMISTFMGAVLLVAVGSFALGGLHILVARNKPKVLAGYGAIFLAGTLAWGLLLAGSEQVSYVTDKLTAQVSNVSRLGLEGDQTSRLELWEMSFNTFTQFPVFGVGPVTGRENPILHRNVGGHASWLDLLAEYGFVGSSFYWLWLALIMRRLSAGLRQHWQSRQLRATYFGLLISCSLFIIGGAYNPVIFVLEIYSLFVLIATNVPMAEAPRGQFDLRVGGPGAAGGREERMAAGRVHGWQGDERRSKLRGIGPIANEDSRGRESQGETG